MIILSGCGEDFFNRQAGDRITPEQHYYSTIDAGLSMEGTIITLQEAMPRLIMLDGLRSDMMEVTPSADAHQRQIHEQVFLPGNPYTQTADLYKMIININEVLANIDKVAENDREFDEYVAYYYDGALITMRAWVYLTLVRLNNGTYFLGEDNMTSFPDSLPWISREVMIDNLINELIPYVYDPTVGNERIEIPFPYMMNTKGLLGELYLEAGDYVNAVVYLKMACESYLNSPSWLKVDNTFKDDAWSAIFLNSESQNIENLSVVPFSSVEDQFNPLADWCGRTNLYMVKPTAVLVDSFMAQLPAAGEPGDLYRGLGVTFGVDTLSKVSETEFTTESYITKYEIDKADPFSSDIILSRAADLHLLLAEAYNRIGTEESQEYAMIFLNQGINAENPKPAPYARWSRNIGIRGRVYLQERVLPEGIEGEEKTRLIEDFIIAERAMELAYEGKRWSDLVRVAQRRGEPEFLADKVAAKFEGTPMYDQIRTKLMDPSNWYLPAE
jgi:tetratricopeptide (TPR) repeat protein